MNLAFCSGQFGEVSGTSQAFGPSFGYPPRHFCNVRGDDRRFPDHHDVARRCRIATATLAKLIPKPAATLSAYVVSTGSGLRTFTAAGPVPDPELAAWDE
jgi:hypothetical protein